MVFQDSTNLNNISKYIVDSAGDTPYTTIQSALDAANTAGGGIVYVRPGTYTENLTCYNNTEIVGAVGEVDAGNIIIDGIHVPPAAGTFAARNIQFDSATNIFNSAVAGTAEISINECVLNATNGYTLNLVNWTGTFRFNNCNAIGTNDGFVNNTGAATIFTNNSQLGVGAGNTFIANGTLRFDLTYIVCPATLTGAGVNIGLLFLCGGALSLGGTATWTIDNSSKFYNTLTTADTATVSISNTTFETGANQAITHGSANELILSNVTIDSSNAPAIGGAGAGNLTFGSVTYLDDSTLAGTLTVNRTTAFVTGEARATNAEIIPDTTIGAGIDWRGVNIDGAALDPTGANSSVYATNIDLSGVAQTNDPDLRGVSITMPTTAGQGCDSALNATGYGIASTINCSQRLSGFYTDATIVQDADTTAFTAVDSGFSQIVNVNNAGSTGGDFHAFEVTATGVGVADIFAVGTEPEVGVIHQHTGTFAATAQSWKFNGGYTDVTAAFDNPAVDVTIFDGDNDYIYIGANAAFSQIRVILNTVAGRNIFPVFEYSTVGPTWTTFTPVDATQGFTQDGIISFDSANLAGWASVIVNGANHFYIRIQRTRNNIITTPIEDTIRILQPVEYYWNEDGDILSASLTANGVTDTTQTQFEIATYAASGSLDGIGPLTNGQLVIGSTGVKSVAATLTAGDGVGITNGAGSITIAATGGGLPWSVETGAAVAAAIDSGYIANRAGGVTFTLPTTAAVGSILRICSIQGLWTIAQNAGESIVFGAFTTTVGAGGSLVATNVGDTIEIVCTVADTTWAVLSSIGNITVN